MSEIETKVVEILDKLESMTTEYAPEVMDAALGVVRVDAIGNFVTVSIFSLISIFLLVRFLRPFIDFLKKEDSDGYYFLTVIFAIIWGLVWLTSVLATYLDTWMWVGMFNPQLALAHKILGL